MRLTRARNMLDDLTKPGWAIAHTSPTSLHTLSCSSLQPWDFFYFFANTNDSIERRILSGGNLSNLHEIAVKINFDLGFLRVLAQFLISFFVLQLYLTWKNPWPQKKSLSCRQRRHEVYLDKGQKISKASFFGFNSSQKPTKYFSQSLP